MNYKDDMKKITFTTIFSILLCLVVVGTVSINVPKHSKKLTVEKISINVRDMTVRVKLRDNTGAIVSDNLPASVVIPRAEKYGDFITTDLLDYFEFKGYEVEPKTFTKDWPVSSLVITCTSNEVIDSASNVVGYTEVYTTNTVYKRDGKVLLVQ